MSVQYLDRQVRLPSSALAIRAGSAFDEWAMTDAERSALTVLVAELKPEVAIEIGTFRAGSLGVIAKHAKRVYSIDIDPSCKARYAAQFPNVEFVIGRSTEVLPNLLEQIRQSGECLEFVLIDGDHSESGVRGDIDALLSYRPECSLYVILHDSFNPDCRRGMKTAGWAVSPYVHLVELDYVCGRLMPKDEGKSYREMWCGFALAVLLPEPREGTLAIHENEVMAYRAAYAASKHPYQRVMRAANHLFRRAKSAARGFLPRAVAVNAPGSARERAASRVSIRVRQ